ncbi:MAG: hypothetical protein E7354_03315 [Clostridiales bacterium]|nr:hypothetical protein [Clostridiales bacterium]
MAKKIIKRVVIGILCAILIFGLVILGQILYILNCSKAIGSRLSFSRENNIISVKDNEDIRILQLSDTQITALGDSLKAFGVINRTVQKAKPDLIVLTGDNLMNDSTKMMLRHYVRFFDAYKIPWAPVMGNHDYQTKMTMEEQCEIYESGKYCLFQKGTVTDSYGNYYYNISRNGNNVYSLIFMDDAVALTDEHIDWYADTINSIASSNGEVLPSWTFFHIPLVETYYAYYYAEDHGLEIDGEKREGIAFQWDDEGLFDKVEEMGSTKALIYGHDHINSFICDYKGVKMCYGIKTGRTSYYDENIQGGNLFVLKSDSTFTVERIFV